MGFGVDPYNVQHQEDMYTKEAHSYRYAHPLGYWGGVGWGWGGSI